MRIVVDAMGSDSYPAPDVEGAVLAAREYGVTVVLVGDEALIKQELQKHQTSGLSIEVVHASEVVDHHDKPSIVGRSKPNSSIHIGSQLVKDGQADAFMSSGNTGAVLAITTLYTLKRIPGIKRPAISSIIQLRNKPIIMIDIGANADAKPEWMAQFAIMGSVYARHALGVQNPRIGLLSNGEEEGKGNDQIRETSELLHKTSLNFVGNVEPKEVLLGGTVDVMVADGFVGNIFIKTIEAVGSYLFGNIRTELTSDIRSKAGALLVKPALKRVYQGVDPFEIGGAPLLGVDGVVIIGHGRTTAVGMKNAIRQAKQAVEGRIINELRAAFAHEAALES